MTTTQDFVPAQVFHPSELIAAEALACGLDIWGLVAKAGYPREEWPVHVLAWQLYALADRDMLMGDSGARDLQRALGIDAEIWQRMEASWRKHFDRHTPMTDQKLRDFYSLDDETNEEEGA